MAKHQKAEKEPEETHPHPVPHIHLLKHPLHRKFAYLLLIVGCLFLFFALYFTVRTVLYLMHPPHQFSREINTSLIDSWMTIPYISRTYQVPESILFESVGLPDKSNRSKTLKMIAEKKQQDVSIVVMLVRNRIDDFQKQTPPRQKRRTLP